MMTSPMEHEAPPREEVERAPIVAHALEGAMGDEPATGGVGVVEAAPRAAPAVVDDPRFSAEPCPGGGMTEEMRRVSESWEEGKVIF